MFNYREKCFKISYLTVSSINHNIEVELKKFFKIKIKREKALHFHPEITKISGHKQLVNLKTNLSTNELRFQQNTVLPYVCRRAFVTLQFSSAQSLSRVQLFATP